MSALPCIELASTVRRMPLKVREPSFVRSGREFDTRSALRAPDSNGGRGNRWVHVGGWAARLLTDDSVFGVVELQSVLGVGELRCAGRCGPGRRESVGIAGEAREIDPCPALRAWISEVG
jgi:hypothetical protein